MNNQLATLLDTCLRFFQERSRDQIDLTKVFMDEEPRRSYATAYRNIIAANIYNFDVNVVVTNRADQKRVEVISLGKMQNENLTSTELWDSENIPPGEYFLKPLKSSFLVDLPQFDELRIEGKEEWEQDSNYYDLEFIVDEQEILSKLGIENRDLVSPTLKLTLQFYCWEDNIDQNLQITSFRAQPNAENNSYEFRPTSGPSANLNGIKSIHSNLLPISIDNFDNGTSSLRNAFNYFGQTYPVEYEITVRKNKENITPAGIGIYIEAEEDNLDEDLNLLGNGQELFLEDEEEQTVLFSFDAGIIRSKLQSKFGNTWFEKEISLVMVPFYLDQDSEEKQSKAYIHKFKTNYDIRNEIGLRSTQMYANENMSLFGTKDLLTLVQELQSVPFTSYNQNSSQEPLELQFNDGSLPFGGLFHVWKQDMQFWKKNHSFHQFGSTIDIRYPINHLIDWVSDDENTPDLLGVRYNINTKESGKVRDIVRILSFQTLLLENNQCLPLTNDNLVTCRSLWLDCLENPESTQCAVSVPSSRIRNNFKVSLDRIGTYIQNMRTLLKRTYFLFSEKPGLGSKVRIENAFQRFIETESGSDFVDNNWHINLIKDGHFPDRFNSIARYGGKPFNRCLYYCDYLVHRPHHFNHVDIQLEAEN